MLVVEVQTQYLKAAKLKAATPDAGMWCLQDIGMPMKFFVTMLADLHKVLEQSTLSHTVSRPQTTHTGLDPIWSLTWGPAGWQNHAHQVHPKGLLTTPTTPITTAMSGFSLASLYRGATSIQYPPAPLHHTPALDPTQGTYYAVFDPTNQTITPLQNQCYQPPFQMVGQYQPPPYQYQPVHMVPSPMQQMGTQQFQPLIPPLTQPHRPTHPQLSPQGQPSYSREEINDALQGDITDQPNLGENYMDLLREDEEDASTNSKMPLQTTHQ